ncbi:hypothetical protein [Owenweeksia hongkongensis]|uniref:hypothetical protein n=1 Tax=Owenweeksia hongkongensis TaxID=253245 RepID=UPI003A92386B
MNFIPLLILFTLTSSSSLKKEINLDNLFETRWVLNKGGGYIPNLEEFDFVIYNTPQAKDLPYQFQFAGLILKKNGTLLEYVWNKCGTGNPPDFYEAEYQIEKIENEVTIQISNSRQWDGDYIIQGLTKSNLKMIRINLN